MGDIVTVTLIPEAGFGQPDPAFLYEEALENGPPPLRYVAAETTFRNDSGDTKNLRRHAHSRR